jgi:hypothetical protein
LGTESQVIGSMFLMLFFPELIARGTEKEPFKLSEVNGDDFFENHRFRVVV